MNIAVLASKAPCPFSKTSGGGHVNLPQMLPYRHSAIPEPAVLMAIPVCRVALLTRCCTCARSAHGAGHQHCGAPAPG